MAVVMLEVVYFHGLNYSRLVSGPGGFNPNLI